jgi:glycosyltransferase involved in cell wall biosynthesis
MPNLRAHVKNVIGRTEKCFTIPQGYSPDFYANQEYLDSSYIEKYIPKNVFIVMYAGTINNNNPIEVLLEAAKLLFNESIYFLIVGEGNNKENLTQKYKDVKNIIFAPSVPKNKVNHLLSFSSVCFDSFSSNLATYGLSRNKWIDYMYAGKPIICSYSGFQSMINESSSGSFVEFNNVNHLVDELLKYKNMSELKLREKGMRAHEFIVNKRSFETLANDYLKIFNV